MLKRNGEDCEQPAPNFQILAFFHRLSVRTLAITRCDPIVGRFCVMLFLRPVLFLALVFTALTVSAENEGCLHCDKSVEVTGGFLHYKINNDAPIVAELG